MPSLRLTTLAVYRAYFTDIATQHIDIDGFKWGDKDVVRTHNRSDITSNFLWAIPYENVRYSDSGSDNQVKNKRALVSYLEVRDSELFSSEDAQYDACEVIIEQIIARILRDKRGADVAGTWTMIATSIGSFATKPIEHTIGSTKYIGWELSIEFIDNTNFAFDAQKWNDTLTP
jgi:hypothetical protein